jgi:hypothetical protein
VIKTKISKTDRATRKRRKSGKTSLKQENKIPEEAEKMILRDIENREKRLQEEY